MRHYRITERDCVSSIFVDYGGLFGSDRFLVHLRALKIPSY